MCLFVEDYLPCRWGYCQTRDQPQADPKAGKCSSSADCPKWAPTCSMWGYCQEGGGGGKGGANREKGASIESKNHFPTETLLSGGRKAGGGRRGGNQIQKKVILKPFTFRLSASIMQGKGRSRGGAAGGGRSRGAGGPGGGGGNCPAPSVTQCAGQVSNCWSVGEPDVDCPNLGLCCFNGCANVCQSQGR